MTDYRLKYLKYKAKYLKLKAHTQTGGGIPIKKIVSDAPILLKIYKDILPIKKILKETKTLTKEQITEFVLPVLITIQTIVGSYDKNNKIKPTVDKLIETINSNKYDPQSVIEFINNAQEQLQKVGIGKITGSISNIASSIGKKFAIKKSP